jgi:hypothetical protein
MSRPSDVWKDYGSWTNFCNENPQFSPILLSNVPKAASNHNQGKSCTVTPGKFAFGGLNVLCEVLFEDGIIWLCRAGWLGEEYSDRYVKGMIESTVTTMRYLKTNSELPLPDVYGYESDRVNSEIGAAYMFLEPLPGTANDDKVSAEEESIVQHHVAYVTTELSRHTFPTIGWLKETDDGIIPGPMLDYAGQEYGPFHTSVDFFKYQAQRIRQEHLSSEWAIESPKESRFACWLYDQLALHLDEYNSGPFPLMHPEVCKSQLLLTPNFELVGVIDWDTVGTVPWLLLNSYPATLKVPWPRVDCGRFSARNVTNILNKRKLYVDALTRLAEQHKVSAIVKVLDNEGEKVEMVDLMVYFGDPYYRYDGKRIYDYLFRDLKQPMEEFRNDETRWQ